MGIWAMCQSRILKLKVWTYLCRRPTAERLREFRQKVPTGKVAWISRQKFRNFNNKTTNKKCGGKKTCMKKKKRFFNKPRGQGHSGSRTIMWSGSINFKMWMAKSKPPDWQDSGRLQKVSYEYLSLIPLILELFWHNRFIYVKSGIRTFCFSSILWKTEFSTTFLEFWSIYSCKMSFSCQICDYNFVFFPKFGKKWVFKHFSRFLVCVLMLNVSFMSNLWLQLCVFFRNLGKIEFLSTFLDFGSMFSC